MFLHSMTPNDQLDSTRAPAVADTITTGKDGDPWHSITDTGCSEER